MKRPGVYFNENVDFELNGEGAKIPVFIGYTGNTGAKGELQEFRRWSDINKAVENGGIGIYEEGTSNLLLKVLKDFYEEVEVTLSDDLGVSKVYVIDLGEAATKDAWLNAFATAKSVNDIQTEVYVGFDKVTDEGVAIKDLIAAAYASMETETYTLQLRTGFVYVDANDEGLIKLTADTKYSRIGFIEPLLFGKTIARICITPYYIEPGYLEYRTIEPSDLINRTPSEEQALQDAGIIFNRVEKTSSQKYCKINLAVSSAFASNPRPADALFHARFNADNLLRAVFDACYPQIKANEQSSNFVKLQTQIDKVIDDEVSMERMIKFNEDTNEGTRLIVSESDSNPYDLYVKGTIQPVNCTVAIEVQATLNTATTNSTGV